MQSTSAIALSGMTAATSRLGAAAHNVANQGTAGFRRAVAADASLPTGGVRAGLERAPEPGGSIETDMVGLLSARHAFAANLAVFRTADALLGTLVDTTG